MTFTLKKIHSRTLIQSFVIVSMLVATQVSAAIVAVAEAPLVSATTSQVLPNLMYILDNSGSMGNEFMPDYVDDSNKCKGTGVSGEFNANCGIGDPPYNASIFNTLAYNPAITYAPPVTSNGIAWKPMNGAVGAVGSVNPALLPQVAGTATNGWTQVRNDAYGIYSTSTTSLVPNVARTVGYPDKVWCNTTSASTADLLDLTKCKKNGPQYIYPNNTGTQATSFNQPYTLHGHPYYYTVSPGEYCTDKNLTSCITATAPSGTNTFPATLRWCNSSARTNCQAKYLDSGGYTFAKWSGIASGTATIGKIKINADTITTSPGTLSVSIIKVDGVSIIPAVPSPALTITNTTNATQRNTLATNIAAAINARTGDDFTATASGDEVTITYIGALSSFAGTIVFDATKGPAIGIAGTKAVGSITFTRARNTTDLNSVSVGSVVIMSPKVTSTASDNTTDLATKVKNNINSFVSSPDYVATSSGDTVTITAASEGVSGNGTISTSLGGSSQGSGNIRYNSTALTGGTNGITANSMSIPHAITQFTPGTPAVNTFNRIDIEPTTLSYPKASSRTDCTGATCSYDNEMTNFANWYSYYRNRMMMMKTSTSRAFNAIDTRYRVGFITINPSAATYLPIDIYGGTQKATWYERLFAAGGNSSTPLRQSLSTVGRIFAGKKPIGTSDPVQYSCQQNFALLTTDGYWNGGGGREINGTSAIGNLDGTGTGRPQFEGPTASSDSLADAAKYYYDTDLRDSSEGNCTGALGTDVCLDNVFVSPTDNNVKQHMTTFTLGLGVDGELTYVSDYRNSTSGDYYEITQGTKNWPVPAADSQRAVDDLWHAAVNGQGTYFSAQDPNQLKTSLSDALQSIGAKVGAGAAAATSTLNPVAGDNFAYVASYATVKWTGNLEAREINLTTGEVSEDATWCVESVQATSCAAPSSIVSEDVAGATVAYCVTPGADATTCTAEGLLVGTDCKVEIASSCSGTMTKASRGSTVAEIAAAKVGPLSDSRTIFIKDSVTNSLVNFSYTNLPPSRKSFFENTWLSSNLSHWSTLTPAQQAVAGGNNLVDYLRGQTGFEDRVSNNVAGVDNRLYRVREATLGDALESTPIFIGVPKLNYVDLGYGTFKTTQATRQGTVYMGANDGMMHAFNATNGVERWAYIPSMVLPKLYKLADKNYATSHTNYVNGDAVVNDVCVANCSSAVGAVWKTILVGGLNGGGSGYYALDVTNPTLPPTLLWEFTSSDDEDLGITYGTPIITKKSDGTWVVLVTSGYNNNSGTTTINQGKGFLYVLNVSPNASGQVQILRKISTGVGSAASPSGLAKISAYVDQPDKNNTALFVYGGDLEGNLWRFDINVPGVAGTNPFNMAILKDSSGNRQPITVAPELTDVDGKRLVLVGTGKYLEIADLTDTRQQSLYAITDDSVATLDNPRLSSTMVSQTLVTNGSTRTIQEPANDVNYASGRGWYIDLPDSGERQNVSAQLVFGTLLVPTIVPSNTVCSPGGYGWLNFLNYRTGSFVGTNVVSSKTNAPIVGINVVYIGGKPKVSVVTADNPTPEFPAVQPTFGGNESNFANRRMIWRELINAE